MPIRMASVQEMNVVGDGIHYEISAVLSDPITTIPPTWYQRGWYHCYSTLWPGTNADGTTATLLSGLVRLAITLAVVW